MRGAEISGAFSSVGVGLELFILWIFLVSFAVYRLFGSNIIAKLVEQVLFHPDSQGENEGPI
jgi:hypothetical protein